MLRTSQKIAVHLNDKIESRQADHTELRGGRRKRESVSDLEIRQEGRLQRSLICTATARRTLAVAVRVCVVMLFILFSVLTGSRDVIDYYINSIPVIKSPDDLVL